MSTPEKTRTEDTTKRKLCKATGREFPGIAIQETYFEYLNRQKWRDRQGQYKIVKVFLGDISGCCGYCRQHV